MEGRISIDNKNRILFYGNYVGYVNNENAVVDMLFQNDELRMWLEGRHNYSTLWKEGVYDKLLISGDTVDQNTSILKTCRIWQLKSDVDVAMKFIGYEELISLFKRLDPNLYLIVFDGEIETNDLEGIYAKFNLDHPTEYKGHSLSISDVVELYDDNGSKFYYVDNYGFKEISFEGTNNEMYQNQVTLGY